MSHAAQDILAHALALAERGERAALCAVVRARGSTPQTAGALMLVDGRGELSGTVGGGCVEAEVRRLAFDLVLACDPPRSRLLRFQFDHDYGWDDGLVCGGSIEIAAGPAPDAATLRDVLRRVGAREPAELVLHAADEAGRPRRFALRLPPRDRLLIAGAGHVGQATTRLASRLEFDVTLFDDRADCLAAAPPGTATVHGDIAAELRRAFIDPATWAIVVTRGHRHDEEALAALVGRGARYLGMIGSRRKVKLIFDELRARGVDDAHLAAVRAPIGLAIGGVTVEEIALSIAAQLVETRRRGECAAMPSVVELAAAPVEASVR